MNNYVVVGLFLFVVGMFGEVGNVYADAPACSSNSIKESIKHDTVISMEKAVRFFFVGEDLIDERTRTILFPTKHYEISLVDMYETSHSDAIRSCAARLKMVSSERENGQIELIYDAIGTEDGNVFYRANNLPITAAALLDNYVLTNNLGKVIANNAIVSSKNPPSEDPVAATARKFFEQQNRSLDSPMVPPGGGSHFGQGGSVPGYMGGTRRSPQ